MEQQLYLPKRVSIGAQALEGALVLPPRAQALIVFAHGSGSGRRSPRNLQVAHALNEQRLGTLLFDLLRPEEALDRDNVFDIELLGRRVTDAMEWLERRPSLAALPLGLFGASTGAAAALVAAAARPERVFAVVSRGGRPDLAGTALRARDGKGCRAPHGDRNSARACRRRAGPAGRPGCAASTGRRR